MEKKEQEARHSIARWVKNSYLAPQNHSSKEQ
jgi:hypothetical protein